jgi:aryl-alcohol dehydrogenase-like predicted oxidoreductase
VPLSERILTIANAVVEAAKAAGKSPAQVALNWLRSKDGVIPIVGARKLSQLKDNLSCFELALAAPHLKHLDEVSRVEVGFPMDFLHRKEVHDFLHGGLFERIQR